jgi:predicted nucleic acid-binding protein
MNVYVESNFVLEHALEQEECDSCSEIIQLASQGRITLLIPAFSLAEPHQAIASKAKGRSRLSAELSAQLGELGRSKPHRDMPSTFGVLPIALIARAQFEREGIRRTLTELISTAEIIPLDSVIIDSAMRIEDEYALSGQDAIVLASVLAHLETTKPEESYFLNRNSRDFDDPDVRERLDALNCQFFAQFAPALARISARLK